MPMKAVMCTAYGSPDALRLVEVEVPAVGDNDVLIRVMASTVTMGDCELRTLSLPLWTRIPVRLYMGYRKPKRWIPGMEFAGVVAAVGKNVTRLKKGDQVFASSGMRMGGNAEYIVRPASAAIGIKPPELPFEEAATIPVGGINALHFLRRASIQPGQKALVIGAGGSIGTYAVLLAKMYGADVTAVDHTGKLEMLRRIGADTVIDYTKENFWDKPVKYDVIFDAVYASGFRRCVRSLTPRGYYLMANTGPRRMLMALFLSMFTGKKTVFALAAETTEDLNHLAQLIVSGKIKPVIDRIFPLAKLPEAHDYVEKGLKKGNVVIAIGKPLSQSGAQ